MLSFQDQYTFLQNQTFDTSAGGLTIFKQNLNSSLRVIYSKAAFPFLEILPTVSTVASQSAYFIPNSIRKPTDIYVTVGSTIYMPRPVFDAEKWKFVLRSNIGASDAALFYYIQGNQVLIQPTPASSGNTISFRGRAVTNDLTQADYTTGTVSISGGGTTVVGVGTAFGAPMVNSWLQVSVPNGGDGLWYQIASVQSSTSLTLAKPYLGSTLSTDNYKIGQMSLLPESFQELPIWRSLALHYQRIQDGENASLWWKMYDGGAEAGLLPDGSPPGGLLGQLIDDAGETLEGKYIPPSPNLTRENLAYLNPNYPQPDASGF